MVSRFIDRNYLRAGCPSTSCNQLRELARSSIPAVRRRVAENREAPVDVLRSLAYDQDPEVRAAVGLNKSTPPDVVFLLVRDENVDVRYRWLKQAISQRYI